MSDHGLTEAGRTAVAEIARRHGVGTDTVLVLLDALERGGGVQAQFSHPELGGLGQWSRGGMIMVGDVFNTGLKARVDALCTEVAGLVGDRSLYLGGRPPNMHGAAWWPDGLGTPSTSGAQNDLRYAVFPETRRLAIGRGTHVDIYDTGEHRIHGVSQQQGVGRDLVFTSQLGRVALHELPRVGGEAAPRGARAYEDRGPAESARFDIRPGGFQTQSQSQSGARHESPRPHPPTTPETSHHAPTPTSVDPKPSASPDDDIFAKIERLHALQVKGILTEAEFAEKKKELLARI